MLPVEEGACADVEFEVFSCLSWPSSRPCCYNLLWKGSKLR